MAEHVVVGSGDHPVTAREKVLSTPELLERILEYAASGEPWKKTRQLRLVCTTWRDTSVKALYLSRDLPKAEILTIDRFRDWFPVGSRLPIQVELGGIIDKDVFSFLADFAEVIAEIHLPKRPMFKILPVPENLVLNMVDLRRIKIRDNYNMDFPYVRFPKLLNKILEKADKLTHMNITCTVSDLGKILSQKQPPRLGKLDVTLCAERKSQDMDLTRFTSLLEKFLPNLQSVSVTISAFNWPANNEPPAFLLPRLPEVKDLSIIIPAGIQEGFRLSDGSRPLVYENLKKLSLEYRYNKCRCDDDDESERTRTLEHGLPECPTLESFECYGFSDHFMLKLMPMVFSQMTTLKTLSISVNSRLRGTSGKATELLTGIRKGELPRNTNVWSSLLEGKTDVITNLKCLESFKIRLNQRKVKCSVGAFLFKTVFFQMPNLRSLVFSGYVKVDGASLKAWMADGRNIGIAWSKYMSRSVPLGGRIPCVCIEGRRRRNEDDE